MFPFRRVLVAAACTEADRLLACWCARMAAANPELDVHVVHVQPPTAFPPSERVRNAAAAFFQPALAEHPRELFRVELLFGDRLQKLLQYAATFSIDLIVAGRQVAQGANRSLARRLAMRAPASVLVVPSGSGNNVSRILAAIDFTRFAVDVLRTTARFAAGYGLDELTALHVYYNKGAAASDRRYEEELALDEEVAFGNFLRPLDLPGVTVRASIEDCASVPQAILYRAEEDAADLIVMATRGRSPAAGMLLNSETDQVVARSPVPVLAVKNFGSRRGVFSVVGDPRFRQPVGPRFA